MTNKTFVVSWCSEGLECVVDFTRLEMEAVFDILSNKPHQNTGTLIRHLILRAQANQQRHYEIYMFAANKSMSEDDIRKYFESAPQMAADKIREIGTKIYANRASVKPKIV